MGAPGGGTVWSGKTGAPGRAGPDCRGAGRARRRGGAAPPRAWDATRGRRVSLEHRTNICRPARQQAPPLAWESRELLALTAYVARQSRGLPIEIAIDQRAQPFLDAGRAIFHRRQGQLILASSECPDDNRGRQIPGRII